jgi:hypothetical protein
MRVEGAPRVDNDSPLHGCNTVCSCATPHRRRRPVTCFLQSACAPNVGRVSPPLRVEPHLHDLLCARAWRLSIHDSSSEGASPRQHTRRGHHLRLRGLRRGAVAGARRGKHPPGAASSVGHGVEGEQGPALCLRAVASAERTRGREDARRRRVEAVPGGLPGRSEPPRLRDRRGRTAPCFQRLHAIGDSIDGRIMPFEQIPSERLEPPMPPTTSVKEALYKTFRNDKPE